MKKCFGKLTDYRNHVSSYFNLPASLVVVIAYFLPGLLNLIYSGFSYFASLILIAVAVFEKKSLMVRQYCFQFCFYCVILNIVLTGLSLIRSIIPLVGVIVTLISIVAAVVTLVVFFYSLYRALQFKYWHMPWVSDFINRKFFGIEQ